MSVRIYDIPHFSSRLVTISALATAPFAGGSYIFPDVWTSMILPTFLKRGVYIVRQVQFSSDIAESDWQANWTVLPKITWGLTSDALGPLFRQPLPLLKYSEGVEYIETILCDQEPTEIKFRLTGELSQSPSMIGKANIRATVSLYTYEITDDDWVREYRARYSK